MSVWLIVAISGIISSCVSIGNLTMRIKREDRRRALGDTEDFRRETRGWERVVLTHKGTVRDVKRYANQARFVAAGRESGEMMRQLVGFAALDELGLIRWCPEDGGFDRWKREVLLPSVRARVSDADMLITIETWESCTRDTHWTQYRKMSREVGS